MVANKLGTGEVVASINRKLGKKGMFFFFQRGTPFF